MNVYLMSVQLCLHQINYDCGLHEHMYMLLETTKGH